MAAALDQQVDFVAGCFSRDFENTKTTGEQLYLDPARCYKTYQEMAQAETKLPADERIDFVSIVTPNDSHFAIAKAFLEAGMQIPGGFCHHLLRCSRSHSAVHRRTADEGGRI